MNILFWNIHKKNSFFDTIVSIVKEEDIDIVFFAEFPEGTNDFDILEKKLKTIDNAFTHFPRITNRIIETFSRINKPVLEYKLDEKRYSVFQLNDIIKKEKSINLFVCHLPDKMNNSEDALGEKARNFRERIEEYEKSMNCFNSIVCGDFNMNPFEKGMYYANTMNAVMAKAIAVEMKRTVDGKDYRYFYNPMWGHLGDNGKSCIPGTYFFHGSNIDKLHWHILDQVILRPSVIDVFDDSQLKILCAGSNYNLLTARNQINHTDFSDHLPIKFKLKL